jgi:hypothetical protein
MSRPISASALHKCGQMLLPLPMGGFAQIIISRLKLHDLSSPNPVPIATTVGIDFPLCPSERAGVRGKVVDSYPTQNIPIPLIISRLKLHDLSSPNPVPIATTVGIDFPLSPRERAGVRGKVLDSYPTQNIPIPLSNCDLLYKAPLGRGRGEGKGHGLLSTAIKSICRE